MNVCVRVCVLRARSTQPVCSHLQAQLLTCYRDNKGETLRCSDLAKEYTRCINAAKKVRLRLQSGENRKSEVSKMAQMEPKILTCFIKMKKNNNNGDVT